MWSVTTKLRTVGGDCAMCNCAMTNLNEKFDLCTFKLSASYIRVRERLIHSFIHSKHTQTWKWASGCHKQTGPQWERRSRGGLSRWTMVNWSLNFRNTSTCWHWSEQLRKRNRGRSVSSVNQTWRSLAQRFQKSPWTLAESRPSWSVQTLILSSFPHSRRPEVLRCCVIISGQHPVRELET